MKFTTVQRRRIALLLVMVSSLLLGSLHVGAQERLGSCVTDSNGHFPAPLLGCVLKIPEDTPLGEYNLVGRCPNGGTGAASYANSTGGMTVTPNRVNPGQRVVPSGDGCQAHSLVSFTLERIGPLVALGNTLTGTAYAQDRGTRTLTARISVVGPPSTTKAAAAATTGGGTTAARGGTLARTGFQALPWLASGLLALTVGGALILAGRRRRNGTANTPH